QPPPPPPRSGPPPATPPAWTCSAPTTGADITATRSFMRSSKAATSSSRGVIMAIDNVKALTFDVFGTVVDWRSSLIREGETLGKKKGLNVDWAKFADAWRGLYQPAMDEVRSGRRAWAKLDDLHRESLEKLLTQFAIKGLSEAEIDHVNRAWHRLDPWPDSVPGLTRLKKKFVLATL